MFYNLIIYSIVSSNTKEDLILPTCAPTIITRSNSIATERAHSLESEKLDNLDHLKKPDNSIALSWTDVSGECSKPGCQGLLLIKLIGNLQLIISFI